MGETVRVNNLPEGMADDAHASWPPRELIDSFPGNFPHDFEWRPGETIEVDGEEAQTRARLFRDVLGRYASGVTVVTTMAGGQPTGMTCQSFTSVSLDPPLVAFLPTGQSRAFAAIRRAGTFCVNFLSDGQADLSNQFASSRDDKFDGVEWTATAGTGSPLLARIVGHVDCTVHAVHEAGDHFLVIGKVVDLAVGDADDPLLYYRGAYRT
ncbi:flavin reductase family protein [Nocardioides sp. B-3]|uniref:flavin reductase family protein n=1 Tax=Nocardioides sp. B-3 TaxID=2895565 RepID=UPI0021522C18|nr:flavin reductase family protein [Nocardioides sp. B-3]UUZ59286.1 flavin reductase family protein [Nocardioides sp. B-3]